MTISHWASARARAAYELAYEESLRLWPVPYERIEIETSFGITHGVASGRPDGDPIVLLHAASLTATQWYLQAAALSADYHLLALDILGDIGLSTQARPVRTRDDAADWLSGVLDKLDLERPTLMGSSFGGFHATNLAVRQQSRVGALVLLAPAATVKPFKLLANLFIRLGSLFPMPFTVKPGLRGMMSGGLPDERIVRQMEIGVAGFRYDRRGIYPSEIPDHELSALACPTLLMVGANEQIYDPIAAISRARRLIPSLDAELLPGAGHLLGMQRPAVVNDRIRRFLLRSTPSPANHALSAA